MVVSVPHLRCINDSWGLLGPNGIATDAYHLTENYYIISSETIMYVNNYIQFSTINSQAIDVM